MMASFACTCVHIAKGYLIHFLHASSIPVLFYYLCGLALTLAMIGTIYHTSGLGMSSYSFKYTFIMILLSCANRLLQRVLRYMYQHLLLGLLLLSTLRLWLVRWWIWIRRGKWCSMLRLL